MDDRTMFDNFPQPSDYIPDNRFRCIPHFHLDIMTGETAKHSFEVPHSVISECSSIEVIYKLGIEVVLTKEVEPNDINDSDDVVSITLSSEDTKLFAHNFLNTLVQLKFTMHDDSTVFSEIYKVHVTDSLEG